MDLPPRIEIEEDGPREGFQMEKGPISTADKIAFIDALSGTGLKIIQVTSFVNPKRVPGTADADEVVRAIKRKDGVRYTAAWLNLKGLERVLASPLAPYVKPKIFTSASESLERSNTGKGSDASLDEQRRMLDLCAQQGLRSASSIVQTAFGCNIEGEISPRRVTDCIQQMLELVAEAGMSMEYVRLGDTVGWATPQSIARVVGTVRERWPDLKLGLHLHDTRGTGLANAFMGLMMGITRFDSSVGGLGGCPFAAHGGAAGNICTEDLVHMCHEMGVETGVDLDALIECARMAERIVGHPLPGKVMRGGNLAGYRRQPATACA